MLEKKPINCFACGKIIAKGVLLMGDITINCRCGTANRLQAEQTWLPIETVERKTLINYFMRVGLKGLRAITG